MNWTQEAGVGCVFDPVGGDHIFGCIRCIGIGGSLLTIGYASGVIPSLSVEHLLQRKEVDVSSFTAACQGMAVLHGVAIVLVKLMGVNSDLPVINSVMLRVDVEDFL